MQLGASNGNKLTHVCRKATGILSKPNWCSSQHEVAGGRFSFWRLFLSSLHFIISTRWHIEWMLHLLLIMASCCKKRPWDSCARNMRHVWVKHPSASLWRLDSIVLALQQQDKHEVVKDPLGPSDGRPSASHAEHSGVSSSYLSALFASGESASLCLLPVLWEYQSQTQLQATISHNTNILLTLNKTAKLDKQLVKLVVKEYHPFSIVEGEQF